MANVLLPKSFIKIVFIDELEKLSRTNHFLAFSIMANAIEFLGKCLDSGCKKWDKNGMSKVHFVSALDKLVSFNKYRQYKFSLYKDLRCGFAHSFVPMGKITLSSKNERANLDNSHGKINLKCEDFYDDFKNACLEIISMDFKDTDDKMNLPFLQLPDSSLNNPIELKTEITQSKF